MTSSPTTGTVDQPRIEIEDAISLLLKLMFSGAVGPTDGKGVGYSLVKENDDSFVFIAGLEDMGTEQPIHRYRVVVDRESGKVDPPELVSLSTPQLADAVLRATGQHVAESERFTDGALSISYKISVQEDPAAQYVLQLRHHGNVESMNTIMQLVSSKVDCRVLPLPTVYPIPNQSEQQMFSGMGIQITRFVPGVMAHKAYPLMSHKERLRFVKNFARAFDALWQVHLPERFMIGELRAIPQCGSIKLTVLPDRHHSLGGPFKSVADYLRAHIRGALQSFQKQQGIEEYKSRYLQPVRDFVGSGMPHIPTVVEEIPVVFCHSDMGLHNVIVSASNPSEIVAIIDWEFCAGSPYACLEPMIERLFREPAANGFGREYPSAKELREAFWRSIPKWDLWNQSEATNVFSEWYRFGIFMKAEWRPEDLKDKERNSFWAENIRVVERFLAKQQPVERNVEEYSY
jgi:hypothetical protein